MPRRNDDRVAFFETVQIAIGIIIIILAMIAFIAPERNRPAFPAIFTLAGVLNFFMAAQSFRVNHRNKKYLAMVFAHVLAGIFLLIISVITIASL